MFYCIKDKEKPMFSLFYFGRCYNVIEKAEGCVCVSDAFFPQDLSIRIACFLFIKTCKNNVLLNNLQN